MPAGAPAAPPPFDSLPLAQGRQGRPVLVIRIPRLDFPRPNLLDLYISRIYLRILLMATGGMAGLFYISTFIDLSDKWFKGQTTFGTLVA